MRVAAPAGGMLAVVVVESKLYVVLPMVCPGRNECKE